uniref:Uncharacterized protein n=1 Tax=Anguilla anguilla TaxID=7936 RepID=A0A0E9RI06_ANGAN
MSDCLFDLNSIRNVIVAWSKFTVATYNLSWTANIIHINFAVYWIKEYVCTNDFNIAM